MQSRPPKAANQDKVSARDPERTQQRILENQWQTWMKAHPSVFNERRLARVCLGWLRHFRLRGSLAMLLAAAVPFSGCSRKEPAGGKAGRGAGDAAVPVLVGKAVEKNMAVQITAIGNVQPFTKVAVRSQITGQLAKVHFQEGSEVKKGDPLFTIDPRPSQAAL